MRDCETKEYYAEKELVRLLNEESEIAAKMPADNQKDREEHIAKRKEIVEFVKKLQTWHWSEKELIRLLDEATEIAAKMPADNQKDNISLFEESVAKRKEIVEFVKNLIK